MKLRPYQEDCVKKMIWDLQNPGNSIVMVAQGGGKSLIIADFAHQLGTNILILQPSKELLKQNVDKMLPYVDEKDIGIFSASMNSKEIKKFTFGTIQSVYKHPELFQGFNIAIVDECDLINPKKLSGMYNKFFKQAKITKVYGLTGTPFRQDSYYKEPPEGWGAWKMRRYKNYSSVESITTTKMITRYKEQFWMRMLYVLNTKDLLDQGYLAPLNYIDLTLINHEDIPTNQSKSDFDLQAYEELISTKEKTIIDNIRACQIAHKSILVYCSSVDQAERLSSIFPKSKVVSSETPAKERDQTVSEFKNCDTQVLFNVSVFTVGFDHPELDCVIITRPTRSLRLHLQILGRGTRMALNKVSCDVFDFAGNVRSLGKLEDIRVEKVNNLWDVTSPAFPSGFHLKPLYTHKITIKN